MVDTLKPYDPTWSEQLGGLAAGVVERLGGGRTGQQNAYELSQRAAGLIPGVSNALSANDAYKGYLTGDWPRATMGAIGALPIPGAGMEERSAINAYHWSTRAFDKFDDAKMGGGAEGLGHYFGEHPATAKNYAPNPADWRGDPANLTGSLYNVTINRNPEHFMDWQKSFDDQHPLVQNELRKIGINGGASGEDIWRSMAGQSDDEDYVKNAWKAFDKLQGTKIPGIRYDAYETPASVGTSNYTVFNGKDVSINSRTPFPNE